MGRFEFKIVSRGLSASSIEIWEYFDRVGIWKYGGFSGADEFFGVRIWESRLFLDLYGFLGLCSSCSSVCS